MKTLNKKLISYSLSNKLGKEISTSNISDVLSIFFEEFLKELQEGKHLRVKNFCTFRLEKTKPRKHYNYWTKQFAISKGRPQLKMKLSNSLRKKISKHLDLLKTFIGEENK